MRDAECAESKEKSNSRFIRFLFLIYGLFWSFFVIKTVGFRLIFTITRKIKIGKLIFHSLQHIAHLSLKPEQNWVRGVYISLVNKKPTNEKECKNVCTKFIRYISRPEKHSPWVLPIINNDRWFIQLFPWSEEDGFPCQFLEINLKNISKDYN